jgi:hypothetical protein
LAKPLQVAEPGRYRDIWQELRSESAPLRVVGGDQLVSAPISFFDSKLISYVTDDWQKVARAVGQALASQIDDCIIQAGDLLLVARVAALVESGRLEIRGEFANDMHVSEVRLPKPQ